MRMLRTISLCLTMLIAAPAFVTGGGCAIFQDSTPNEQVRDVGATYLAIVNTLNAARASGAIGYDRWHRDINPLIQEGRNVFTDMRLAAQADDATSFSLLEASLSGIVSRLTAYSIQTQGDDQ